MFNSNQGALDANTRNLAQFGQQGPNNFPIMGLMQGGMQGANMPGARAGMPGLQAASTPQQSTPPGRYGAGALQSNLQQQLNQAYAAQQRGNLAHQLTAAASMPGAGQAGTAAVGGAAGRIAINQLAARQSMDRAAAAANLGINLGGQAITPAQRYNAQLAALSSSQQVNALNTLSMNNVHLANLAAQGGRMGAAQLNLLNQQAQQQQQQQQQQNALGNATAAQELLSMLKQPRQVAGTGGNIPGPFSSTQMSSAMQQMSQQAFISATPQVQASMGALSMQQQQQALQSAGQEGDTSSFESSEFPSLGGQPRLGANVPEGYAGIAMRKPGMQTGNEFSMSSEDFPALQATPQRQDERFGLGQTSMDGTTQGANLLELMMLQRSFNAQSASISRPGPMPIKLPPGVSIPDTIKPVSAQLPAADRFGLLGLLSVIKMTDPNLTMLSLGTDLTSLGLNLNSSGTLYKSFVSPLSDTPVKHVPDFKLPVCYGHTPQGLQAGYLTKFKDETLFYIFFSMPGDEVQLIAADELSQRGWFYHKRFKTWLIHAPNLPVQKTARGERGTFQFFDLNSWDVVARSDVEIWYDDIEAPPKLPRGKGQQNR